MSRARLRIGDHRVMQMIQLERDRDALAALKWKFDSVQARVNLEGENVELSLGGYALFLGSDDEEPPQLIADLYVGEPPRLILEVELPTDATRPNWGGDRLARIKERAHGSVPAGTELADLVVRVRALRR